MTGIEGSFRRLQGPPHWSDKESSMYCPETGPIWALIREGNSSQGPKRCLSLWFPNVTWKQVSLVLWGTALEWGCLFWHLVKKGVNTYSLLSSWTLSWMIQELVRESDSLKRHATYLNGKTPHSATPVIDSSYIPTEAALPCMFPDWGNQYHPCNSFHKNVRLNLLMLFELKSNSWVVHGKGVCV